jgi:dihydrofolate reductase
LNIVVTSRAAEPVDGVVFTSLDRALDVAESAGYTRVYAIGGASIYRHFTKLAHRLLITEVALDVADADTFFAESVTDDWVHLGQRTLRAEAPNCVMHEYLRAIGPHQT